MSIWLGLFSFESKLTLCLNPKICITVTNIVAETVNTANNHFHFRYFVLLAKHASGNKNLTPLPYIMDLLLRAQSHPSVTTSIMEMVERLLTLQDHQEERNQGTDVAPDIPVTPKLQVDVEAITKLSCK
jgi:serine protease inhibitor